MAENVIRITLAFHISRKHFEALSYLWGLGDIITISAQNMDYSSPEEVENRIAVAIQEGLEVIREAF